MFVENRQPISLVPRPSPVRTAVAIAYSSARAASTSFTIVYYLSSGVTDSHVAIMSVAMTFLLLDFIDAYNFQGSAIKETQAAYTALDAIEPSIKQRVLEKIYLLFDVFKTLTKHYFLFKELNTKAYHYLNASRFLAVLLVDCTVKELFNLSNATHASAKSIKGGAAPCYHHVMVRLLGNKSTVLRGFILLGTIEHLLTEAVIPLLLCNHEFTQVSEESLAHNEGHAVAVGVVIFLLCLLGLQTYLWEGNNTRKNINPHRDDHRLYLPCARWCKCLLYLMGPPHGLANFVSVYFPAKKEIVEHVARHSQQTLITVFFGVAVCTALFAWIGTQLSEINEAQEAIVDRRAREENASMASLALDEVFDVPRAQ